MDLDAFWALIQRTHEAASSSSRGSTVRRQARALLRELKALSDADVIAFRRHLSTQVARAYDWRMWAAGYLAAGGMSDDSFRDFRVWLVHQGPSSFAAVLAEPDSLAALTWDDAGEDFGDAEDLGYVADEILEKRGIDVGELDDGTPGDPVEPTGEPFPEDDEAWFSSALPRLWARTESIRLSAATDYDPDVSEIHQATRFGQYAGLQVHSALTAEVVAQFRETGHDLLDWWPHSDLADLTEVLPIADRLKALSLHAPQTRDDGPLAHLVRLERLQSRTGATNALDLSSLKDLRELDINDRPGLAGLAQLPLHTICLTDTRRALRMFESFPALRELTIAATDDADIDLHAQLPQLELLVLNADRFSPLPALHAPALNHLTIRTSAPTTVDVSTLIRSPGLSWLGADGPVTLTGIAALTGSPDVRLCLRDGARLDPTSENTVPQTWQRLK